MTQEQKNKIIKRIKSFFWRFGCVSVIAGLNWAGQSLGILDLPMWCQGVLGLGLGEITKWLNTNTDMFGARQKE